MATASRKSGTQEFHSPFSTVLSITSISQSWNAVYYDDDGTVWFEPIACFAVCEKYDSIRKLQKKFVGSIVSRETDGMVVAEDASNFLGIAPPGDTEDDWIDTVNKKLGLNGGSNKHHSKPKQDEDEDEEYESDEDDDEPDDQEYIDETEDEPNEPKVVSRRKSAR